MPIHLEVTDSQGSRELVVDRPVFWVGTTVACEVQIQVAGTHARLIEVRRDPGGLSVRAEPGLPFPVRCATGNLGSRFETVLDGDVINVGPALVKLLAIPDERDGAVGEELDLAPAASPGAPVGSWYVTFMEFADHLEGLRDPVQMVGTALEAIAASTGADRGHIELLGVSEDEPTQFFRSGDGDSTPFRISSSLKERVREGGRVVHVPIAAADPVASQFVSVRKEGISSSIALPLSALGHKVGILYADCVRDGAVLTADDLQRVVFIGRLLASALGNRRLVKTLVRAEPSEESGAHPALQTTSPTFAAVVEQVKPYAPTDYTVLLRGETGVGKEVIARALHDLSPRRAGPFVPVNSAAIPEQLMESMLFGHEKGAFTGATQDRAGHFEDAHGGTILLDEIGDMALDLQAKILRVLQDRVVSPVGSSRQIRVDVRIVAATHQDLEKMVAERRFREDLYYRLRELEILLPPLRERREDILMLCGRFLALAARELQFAAVPELAAETLDCLHRQPWRGNIRELQHQIKGAALRAGGGLIEVRHLGRPDPGVELGVAPVVAESEDTNWKQRLEAQERAALKETLERAGGNLTKAARLFGVPRTTYREKLVKSGLLDLSDD